MSEDVILDPPNCVKPEGTSVEDSAMIDGSIVDNWVVEVHPPINIERITRNASVKIIFFLIISP